MKHSSQSFLSGLPEEIQETLSECDETQLDLSGELENLSERMQHDLFKYISIKFPKLKELRLTHNQLKILPNSLETLINLEFLDLGINELTILPDFIGNLTNLTLLSISSNQLATLPDSIGNLTNLTKLSCADNRLKELPFSLGDLTKLTFLDISHNELTALPSSLEKLTQVDFLLANNNQIKALPISLVALSHKTLFGLEGNQLTFPPQALAETATQYRGAYLDVKLFFRNVLSSLEEVESVRTLLSISSVSKECYTLIKNKSFRSTSELTATENKNEEPVLYPNKKAPLNAQYPNTEQPETQGFSSLPNEIKEKIFLYASDVPANKHDSFILASRELSSAKLSSKTIKHFVDKVAPKNWEESIKRSYEETKTTASYRK